MPLFLLKIFWFSRYSLQRFERMLSDSSLKFRTPSAFELLITGSSVSNSFGSSGLNISNLVSDCNASMQAFLLGLSSYVFRNSARVIWPPSS